MHRPPIFSFEGLDGSGKSTQIGLVAQALRDRGMRVTVPRSPSARPLGTFLRKRARTLDSPLKGELFMIDMLDTMERELGQHADVVIWDRYIDSFYTSNSSMSLAEADELVAPLPRPVLTFFLAIRPDEILNTRTEVLDDHSEPGWLCEKAHRYEELMARETSRFHRVDARKSIDECHNEILGALLRIFEARDDAR